MRSSFQRGVVFAGAVVAAFAFGLVTAQEISPGPPNIPRGLVNALESIAQNIVGPKNVFTTPGPPDDPALNVRVSDTPGVPVHINVFTTPGPPNTGINPGPPNTWLRLKIEDGEVTLLRELDMTIGDADARLQFADLSAFAPPMAVSTR
jgi:hypothetical protein